MAQALYTPAAPPERLALFGMSPEDLDQTVEVLPENWLSFLVMDAMGTQWRAGMSGPTGLDYAAIPSVMSLLHIPKKLRNSVFQDVRVMESEALIAMNTE